MKARTHFANHPDGFAGHTMRQSPTGTLAERFANRHVPKSTGPYYRTVADVSTEPNGLGFYMGGQSDSMWWMDARGSIIDLRIRSANAFLSRENVLSYWTDEYGDSEKLTPIVAILPKSRGFLAGWTMGVGMASSLDTSSIHDTAVEAARAAHSMAEHDAEREREYRAAWRAGQQMANEEKAEVALLTNNDGRSPRLAIATTEVEWYTSRGWIVAETFTPEED